MQLWFGLWIFLIVNAMQKRVTQNLIAQVNFQQ